MQYIDRVKSIKPNDKVLEIGPGGDPHPRSDVYLELNLTDEELAAQRGYAEKPKLKGSVVYYDGGKFPFKNDEFDYVICSHVIEHVSDLRLFTKEMFRVASRGYLEYPTIYYEYLYNFDVHINFIKTDFPNKKIYYLPKSKTSFDDFKSVHSFFYESLCKGYDDLVVMLKPWMFEGFEWFQPFQLVEVEKVSDLTFEAGQVPKKQLLVRNTKMNRIIAKIRKIREVIR